MPHLQVGQLGGSECVCICALVLTCKTGTHHAGGVIGLESIRGPCPLSSKLHGSCPPSIGQDNAYNKLSSFWVNPFTSHVAYEFHQ